MTFKREQKQEKSVSEEKKDHPIRNGVVTMVIGSTAMLFVTTIYNLILAHIWPVTIHFGEYSLANVLFIVVSVLTSVLIAYASFYLAIMCILTWITRSIKWLVSTPEQRLTWKSTLFDRFIDSITVVFLVPFIIIGWWQERGKAKGKSTLMQPAKEMLQQQQQSKSKKSS